MKKTAHQIYKEAKDKKLNEKEFKEYLIEHGVIVPKKSLDKQHDLAERTLNRLKKIKK